MRIALSRTKSIFYLSKILDGFFILAQKVSLFFEIYPELTSPIGSILQNSTELVESIFLLTVTLGHMLSYMPPEVSKPFFEHNKLPISKYSNFLSQ